MENNKSNMNTKEDERNKLGLGLLIALGISSMIGGGIFNSPTDLILVANPQSILIAWGIGGFGVIMLALVFQLLSNKRPELKGGIYSYARAGFGDFFGFNSAWGYWIGGLLGNIAVFTLMIKTLNSLLGPANQLNPIFCFILATIILWTVVYIQTKGTKNVGTINAIVTLGKLIPLVLVVVFGIFVINPSHFFVPDWLSTLASTTEPMSTTFEAQINSAMGIILWCFIGVEASTNLAEKAKSQKSVGIATIISIIIALFVYVAISVISMGVMPAEELAISTTPLADVLGKTIIGNAGSIIVKIGLLISLFGTLISWVMIAAQLPYYAAKEGILPKVFSKENTNGVPTNALYITNGISQIFLFVLLSSGLQNIYNMFLLLATTCFLIPYLLSTLYAIKVWYEDRLNIGSLIISILAVVYSVYVIVAVGLVYLAASFIIYAIGMFAFIKGKKEQRQAITGKEWISITVVLLIGSIMAILLLVGKISI
jgi:arginine:ornithine antiporter / lysine permease